MTEPAPITNDDAARIRMAEVVAAMLLDTKRFADKVVGLPIPPKPELLGADRLAWANSAMQEELQEFNDAHVGGNVVEAADALIDLVYFALGRLYEMGVPPVAVWDAVQAANMGKERGELSKRPGAKGFDAVKPAGWTAPDHSWLLGFTLQDLQAARSWNATSPVLKRVIETRVRKGADYNVGGVELRDYFPFGHQSYAQMIHVKVLRVRSLLQSGHAPKNEALIDTLEDLINYATYHAEAILRGEVPTHLGDKA